jgi:DNA-binding transcriptional LysR family regulator
MDNQIDLIRIFTAATQSASFRETATCLGTSPQVVTRAIQQLEERLGETLFHRSTRSVRITTFGKTFAVRAYALLQSVERYQACRKYRPQASPSRQRRPLSSHRRRARSRRRPPQ